MNPRFHEEFIALSALYYTGEITDEEWALLQIHMAYCADCKRNFEQYRYVAIDVVPAMAAAAAQAANPPHESDASLAIAEQQLLAQLDTAPPVSVARKIDRRTSLWTAISGFAAACVVLLAIASVLYVRSGSKSKSSQYARSDAKRLPPSPVTSEIQGPPHLATSTSERGDEVAQLRQRIATLQGNADHSEIASTVLERRLRGEQAARASAETQTQSLARQLADAQTDLEAMRQKAQTTESSANQQSAHVAELEAKVRMLNVSLEETQTALTDKERMLALDKDFLSHDRDIRDLIGARNLYIADIFDTTEAGKTAKPFGRIFYTQDRSLVFYGFDLEHRSETKHAVAFQAWGSGADRQPVSLGLFYQDDSHKRWVLRCSDAKTLARLNMVYVTVEPPGGSRKPTGPQFLRAYLQIQPNHP